MCSFCTTHYECLRDCTLVTNKTKCHKNRQTLKKQHHQSGNQTWLKLPFAMCVQVKWFKSPNQTLRWSNSITVIKFWVTCSLILHTCSKLVTLWLNYFNNRQFHLLHQRKINHTQLWQVLPVTALNESLEWSSFGSSHHTNCYFLSLSKLSSRNHFPY